MYLVTVFNRATSEAVDTRNFEFGSWNEIGYWLDWYGYNDSKYRVSIYFTE